MLSRLHILLTYRCPLRCSHCYVYGNPHAPGKFTTGQVRSLLSQALKIPTIRWIVFEGGEPFSVFPLLLSSIRLARLSGFSVGVITNGYFARTEATALNFLRPIKLLGVSRLWISDDKFHYKSESNSPAKRAFQTAIALGIPTQTICLQWNTSNERNDAHNQPDDLSIETDLKIAGRAAEYFVNNKAGKSWEMYNRCPLVNLGHPEWVYIDAYGNIQICQGIKIGNAWQTPINELLATLQPESHNIWRFLRDGGPALLAQEYKFEHKHDYLDACHLCYTVRRGLIELYPDLLAPLQVYGF